MDRQFQRVIHLVDGDVERKHLRVPCLVGDFEFELVGAGMVFIRRVGPLGLPRKGFVQRHHSVFRSGLDGQAGNGESVGILIDQVGDDFGVLIAGVSENEFVQFNRVLRVVDCDRNGG